MNTKITLALKDIWDGIAIYKAWTFLAWQEIKVRYRRSVLGPIWITLSLLITVACLGLVYSSILKINIQDYLPYVACNLVGWSLISLSITEGATAFVSADNFIKQIKLPYFFYIFKTLYRNLIIWLHNVIVIVIVYLYCSKPITWHICELIITIPLLLFVLTLISSLLSILVLRFRDLQQIIQSIIQLLFFVTPIMWKPQSIASHNSWIIDINPFYYMLKLINAPIDGSGIYNTLMSVGGIYFGLFVLGIACLSIVFFIRYRGRIAYWI